MIDRRAVMTAGLAGIAAITCGSAGVTALAKPTMRPFFARHRLPLGVQLYAIAPDLDADFDGTLVKLHKMGVRAVEMAGFHGRTASQLRKSFDRAGLRCTSAHIQSVASGNGPSLDGYLDALARDMHMIGITQVVLPIPLLPTVTKSLDEFVRAMTALTISDWQRTAQFLNEKGRALRKRDLSISYHNHNFEFAPLGVGCAIDVLLDETDPSLVSFEMDVGWAASAGIDPIELLRAHPGRFTQMHVKDILPSTKDNYVMQSDPTEVGSGKINWPSILPAAFAHGVRGFYIEQEPPYIRPRMASIAKSAAYLLALKTA